MSRPATPGPWCCRTTAAPGSCAALARDRPGGRRLRGATPDPTPRGSAVPVLGRGDRGPGPRRRAVRGGGPVPGAAPGSVPPPRRGPGPAPRRGRGLVRPGGAARRHLGPGGRTGLTRTGGRMNLRCFQTLVEHSPDAVLLLDRYGTVQYANLATTQVFGCTPEEARGQRALALIQPDDPGVVTGLLDLFEACLRQPRQEFLVSGFYRHKVEQDVLYGEGRLANYLDDPEVGAILFYFRELPVEQRAAEDWGRQRSLTQQRAAEDWRRQRSLLGAILDGLPDQVYVKDELGRFVTANLAAARARGAEPK